MITTVIDLVLPSNLNGRTGEEEEGLEIGDRRVAGIALGRGRWEK